jgi:Fic family protein
MLFKPTIPFNDLPSLPPLQFDKLLKTPAVLAGIANASEDLSYLKGLCRFAHNPMMFLSLPMIMESVASLDIEAYQTTIAEVVQANLFPEKVESEAAIKASQYLQALKWGFSNLKKYQITHKLLCGINEMVIDGSAEYRKLPNAIQTRAVPPRTIYTPPSANFVPDKMSAWERFANSSDKRVGYSLIKAILCHYQFEAIHPFGDGNGRTGRIVMVLQLINDGLLSHPILNVSEFLNNRRPKYYQSLIRVTNNRMWQRYTLFMLRAISKQAKATSGLMEKLKQEQDAFIEKLKESRELKNILNSKLPDHIFENIYTTASYVQSSKLMSRVTATNYLKILQRRGLLTPIKWKTHVLYCIPNIFKMLTKQ